MVTVQAPSLSVVVPFVNQLGDLDACLQALGRERESCPLEVIVVERVGSPDREAALARFPWVRLISAPSGTPIPALRALGFEVASAPLVAVIEDHVMVAAGWARVAVDAASRGESVIGGALVNGATGRLVDWAAFLTEYSQLIPPRPSGPVEWLPGNNTIYDRKLLVRYRRVVEEGRWEDHLHAAMARDGVTLWSRPELLAEHRMHYTVSSYTAQRYYYSRGYAGLRLRGAGLARKAAIGIGALALPPVLLWRVVSTVWRKGTHRVQLLATLPLLAWFTVVWAVGEAIGSWCGPGDALTRVR